MTHPSNSLNHKPHVVKQVQKDSKELAELFKQGLALHQQGQLSQAKAIYEKVLLEEPKHFDTLNFFGDDCCTK